MVSLERRDTRSASSALSLASSLALILISLRSLALSFLLARIFSLLSK